MVQEMKAHISDCQYGKPTDAKENKRMSMSHGMFGYIPDLIGFNPYECSPLDILIKMIPWHNAEYDMPDLFGVYGYTTCGIVEVWRWLHKDSISDKARKDGCKPIEEASELELWKMIALMSIFDDRMRIKELTFMR